ncbi:MAG: redoxin domain-containing protein [Gammaproteobacteria bacterium]|nr:redoxin domain-containing protein [Gammaproteobacteria bacterium]
MKTGSSLKFLLAIVTFCCGVVLSGSTLAQRGSDFALLDQNGVFHQLSRYAETEAVVLFVQGNGDEASHLAMPLLHDLRERYREQGVVVLLLNANPDDTRASVQQELAAQGFDFPVLLDTAQVVARTLDVKTTGEAFILDPASHDVLYRGPLHSSLPSSIAVANASQPVAFLEDALTLILDDTGRNNTEDDDDAEELPAVIGTPIDYSYRQRFGERQISYQDEIVPILRRRCTTCHIENGLAPWAMTSHRMMQGWSPMIREVLITRRMPPGQIDMQVGDWDNIHQMPDDELELLVHWIDGGARREGEADPLVELEPVPPDWALGEPDLIIELSEEAIPATGMVEFKIKRAALGLAEDKWIRAVAYDVGDRSVLHSLLVFALDPAVPNTSPAALIDPDNAEFISLYVPGRTQEVFGEDSGFLLRADRDLSLKLRYVTGGRETVDNTRIGLYFHDAAPELAVRNVVMLNEDFTIAAGESNHVEQAQSEVFSEDVYVESFAPQAHTRGKSMTITAQYPDGTLSRLINVANYNYNWQMNYRLKERLLLPAGSKLLAETVYDNSATNPHNVDPEASVRPGIATADETFSHYVRILESVSP